MNIYRFKVGMEDFPDVERVIEIRGSQTFEDLHNAILSSVSFDNSQLSSFYLCDDDWNRKMEITLIDMSSDESDITPIMNETQIADYVHHIGDKLRYVYDFVLMWSFMLEVTDISTAAANGRKFPLVVESNGEAPKQYETVEKYPAQITEDDDIYINELKLKNQDIFHPDAELEEEEEEDWGDFREFEEGGGGYDYDDRY
jgi:hypothetical protein